MHTSIPILAALAALATSLPVFAEIPAFVPLPSKIQEGSGRFKLDAATFIVAPTALTNEATLLAERLQTVAGIPATIATSGTCVSSIF